MTDGVASCFVVLIGKGKTAPFAAIVRESVDFHGKPAYIIYMYSYYKANTYIFNRKKTKRIIKLFAVISVIVFIIVSITSYVSKTVRPVIATMCEAEVRALAVSGINNAIHIVIDEGLNYQDFVSIQRNNDNEITMIQLNFVKINRLARDLANLSEASIKTINEQTVELPLGAFTGSPVLAGFGPKIDIKLLPIGSVMCDFISNFDDMGINQTRHRLYVDIKTTICIVLPLDDIPLEIDMKVMVVENIIIGEVPETFVKTTQAELDELNLMP
ncbi:MAG: sporulation protein YunB [Christensenellales bacterium]